MPARGSTAQIVADTTVEPLVRPLAEADWPVRATVAAYGPIQPILLDGSHELWQGGADLAIVWTTPERTIPAFAPLLEYEPIDVQAVLAEVDAFAESLLAAAGRGPTLLVTAWVLPPHVRWVQGLTCRHNQGAANVLMQMNLRLAERIGDAPGVIVLDAHRWYAALEGPSFDPKLYAIGKIAATRGLFAIAAAEVSAIAAALAGRSRKVLVVDLDNTLWGGVIGDDGLDGIRLGGHDAIGESFVAFQRQLKALRRRGVLLAVASKNDAAVALECIDSHPEMVLRRDDLAGWRIDWGDKAANLASLASELNLGLDAMVFLDDSPTERDRVRSALPEVLVPDLPADPAGFASFVQTLRCFEAVALTDDDRARADSYRQRAQRRRAAPPVGSLDAWLASLDVTVTVAPLGRGDLPRAVQLLNKTNQFNLAVRRLGAEAFWQWASEPGRAALTFRVADRFGSEGLTGLATLAIDQGRAELVDFVMSCRVMGKRVEHAMLAAAWQHARRGGAGRLIARPAETDRNAPARAFFETFRAAPGEAELRVDRIAAPPGVTLCEEPDHGGL